MTQHRLAGRVCGLLAQSGKVYMYFLKFPSTTAYLDRSWESWEMLGEKNTAPTPPQDPNIQKSCCCQTATTLRRQKLFFKRINLWGDNGMALVALSSCFAVVFVAALLLLLCCHAALSMRMGYNLRVACSTIVVVALPGIVLCIVPGPLCRARAICFIAHCAGNMLCATHCCMVGLLHFVQWGCFAKKKTVNHWKKGTIN